ncbi:hypothetical protein [Clostridium algidicarnis]|uniref:hypothetical protein n=1 Tax=Clostridium algidicarnis TaxID=37659 RepID=UPI0016295BCC|nr:hypothetical protein [Clostridium algidicarnis]MBB6697272.1 hypothetical protein [Clostridium algidicarnis]
MSSVTIIIYNKSSFINEFWKITIFFSKEWKISNPDKDGNIRDYTTIGEIINNVYIKKTP